MWGGLIIRLTLICTQGSAKQYFAPTHHKRRMPSAACSAAYRGSRRTQRNLVAFEIGQYWRAEPWRDARLSWAYNGYLADIWTLSRSARLWLSISRTTSLSNPHFILPMYPKIRVIDTLKRNGFKGTFTALFRPS